ncbi:MAG: Smr/MutS family protein [Deltaproteobacteria bacterium]|nr:Smr/MutS family protein [Deltaproteobacteria bacterium]
MEEASERLEFGAVRAALLGRTQTPLGAAVIGQLAPAARIDEARERIEGIRQARALLDRSEPPPVWGAQDVEASLVMGEKGLMLEGPALRGIADTMHVGAALRRHLFAHEEVAPLLYGLAASLADLSRVATEVLACFDPDGQLADHASPELGPLRQRVRSIRDGIHDKLTELLRGPELRSLLQEDYYTIRADRYVLPIKSSFKNEVKGIVHDASGSGQTVYIEPQALIDLGNRLKIAQSEQLEEEHRILSRLTRLVTREADAVRNIMVVVGRIDALAACGRLATEIGCIPVFPEPEPGFNLIDARHPLLLIQNLRPLSYEEGAPPPARIEVVGNDLGLQPGQQILVFTGPNTGGKTVAMKTIGLLALMARMGLHLPCREGSRIGWYERIEVAIGDQQSIASHLSTFAAHLKALVDTLARADQRSLVLIDEIAADTDPTQGQALAQSILERLADRGAQVVVTTHFERIKAVPFTDKRFRNAGVGFDSRKMRPTYHVSLDVPQGSSAFDIAQNLGLEEAIVVRARSLLGEGSNALEQLIKEVERRSHEMAEARDEAIRRTAEAEAERDRLIDKQEELEREIQAVRLKAREELVVEIERRREEVRGMIARLQAAADAQDPKDAMRQTNQAAEQLARLEQEERERLAAERPAGAAAPKPIKDLKIGEWVHVAKLGRDGEVVSIDGKEAHVAVGNIRMRVSVASLLAPAGPRPTKALKVAERDLRKAQLNPPSAQEKEPTEELDLRGHQIEESIQRLDGFLDYHYGTPTIRVRVIHGHGTGALRDALREHLKRSGYVKSVRPGEPNEGGDGVTVVTLS